MATTSGSKRLLDISANGMAASNSMTYGGLNVATEQYVSTQVSNIVSSAPGALDTLNELAAALGDDPNFATTITTALSGKLSTSHDMTLTLNGDASGSATFTNMGNATLTVVVANDSHTHDGRYYTETEVNNLLAGKASSTHNHNSTYLGLTAKAADANLLDGINSDRFVYGKNARGKSIDLRNGNANTSDATNASGFYYGHTVTGMPDTDWWNWVTVAGADWSGNDGYMFQIAGSFWSDDYRIRRMTSGTVHDWKNLIHSGNIGSYAVTSESYTQHENTSNLSGFYGGNNNGVVIEDIEVDANGHVTAVGTRDLDGRFAAASHNHDTVYTKQSSVTNLGTVYFGGSVNTDEFIGELDAKGCLVPNKFSTMKVAWDYAGNADLDTGAGAVLELAGCQIDVITDNGSRPTITITRPTTGAGGAAIWIYNNQGSGYAPGWRRIWTSNEFSSTNVSNWNTAYSWGDHGSQGYLVTGSTQSPGAWTSSTRFKSSGAIANSGSGNHSLQVISDNNNDAFMAFHVSGDYAVFFGLDGASNRLHTGGWSAGANQYMLWDTRDFSSTDIANWNSAYNNYITGISITGTTTKTITLTQRDGGTISGTFTDLSGAGGDGNDFLINGGFDPGAELLTLEVSNQGVIEIPLPGVMTDNNTTYSVGDGGLTQKNFTSTLKTKLDGIAAGANVTPSWVPVTDPGYLTSLPSHNHDGRYMRMDTNTHTTGGIEIRGSLGRGTYTSASQYHNNADNLVLKGNSVGISSIFFESEKDGTNINHSSDFGFIQFHPYGTGTSGESNELIIGVSNDADDHVVVNAPNVNGFKFRIGANATDYTVWHAGNFNPADYAAANHNHNASYDAAGSAATAQTNAIAHADDRIDNEVLPAIGSITLASLGYTGATNANYITNNNQLTNGAGYITDGNTGWNNTYGFITASSTDTLTNKSGNISQWTNDSGYLTSIPTTLSGNRTIGGDLTVSGNQVITAGSNADVKFSVWSGTTYGIGMTSGVTYGGLNDYAMTFCMNNDSDRGFWWGYSGQSKSSGAMSLTTGGILTVASSITAGGDITAFSDARVKENIEDLEGSLDKVTQLRGVSYNRIDAEERSIGVIAQEIQEVLPEVVREGQDGMLSVAYGNITAVLIEAIKEQQEIISQLEERIVDLENRM